MPAPTPTAVPTVAPASTSHSVPAPAGLLVIDTETRGRDIIATLTEDERSCVRNRMGGDGYQELLDRPVVAPYGRIEPFPLDCLPAREGSRPRRCRRVGDRRHGLTSDSVACLKTVYADADTLEFPVGLSNEPEDILLTLRFILCLTDEEAERLTSLPGGDAVGAFSPSQMRCVDDSVGIEEFANMVSNLTADLLSDEQPPPELTEAEDDLRYILGACGVDLGPVPPSGVEGTFNQVSALWLHYDPELQDLIDCLREAAPVEELDAFFYGASPAPEGVPDCLERYQSLLPSGGG